MTGVPGAPEAGALAPAGAGVQRHAGGSPPRSSLVIPRHRHLKWKALDPLEHLLMVLCGVAIAGFTLSVFCDVVTRELGTPWLWLQLVTTGFFAWGVFIGMAAATRRIDHLNLVEITKRMRGPMRSLLELTNRLVILLVGLAMLAFGTQNCLHDLGSFRAPSLIPLATYTASVPIAGALIVLFAVEQIVNGWRHGFEGPEDADDFAGIVK
jgi:TRAP-type C4-dicarboxylate transport system permease small subunit